MPKVLKDITAQVCSASIPMFYKILQQILVWPVCPRPKRYLGKSLNHCAYDLEGNSANVRTGQRAKGQ